MNYISSVTVKSCQQSKDICKRLRGVVLEVDDVLEMKEDEGW